MEEIELLNLLKAINYPNLDKDIVSLKLIEEIDIKDGSLTITLAISNIEAFKIVEENIVLILKDLFKNINIINKALLNKKSINYGSTHKPNNRAKYAKYVIAVTSGKGGVGKSTISVNLSVALAQLGYKVGLLDADVYGPDVPRMTDIRDDKLKWNDNNKIVPSENFGIKIMSVGLTTPSYDTPLVWRSSVAISALIQFLEDVDWGELDFLVIDMPPGTGDVQLTMAQELPLSGALIVTTPQDVAVDDVSRAIMMFKDINVKIGGLVENMSYFVAPDTKNIYYIFGQDGGKRVAIKYDIPFLGEIPLDIEIRELSDSGKVPVAFGNTTQKEFYQKIAKNLLKNLNIVS